MKFGAKAVFSGIHLKRPEVQANIIFLRQVIHFIVLLERMQKSSIINAVVEI